MAYETKELSAAQMNIFAAVGREWVFERRDAWNVSELGRHLECLGMSPHIGEDVKSMVKGGWFTELAPGIVQITSLCKSEAARFFP